MMNNGSFHNNKNNNHHHHHNNNNWMLQLIFLSLDPRWMQHTIWQDSNFIAHTTVSKTQSWNCCVFFGHGHAEGQNLVASPSAAMCYNKGEQILGTRSPGWLTFLWWHLTFVDSQYGTCFMSLFWRLVESTPRFLENLCTPKLQYYTVYALHPADLASAKIRMPV